jgi:hypothetical protein
MGTKCIKKLSGFIDNAIRYTNLSLYQNWCIGYAITDKCSIKLSTQLTSNISLNIGTVDSYATLSCIVRNNTTSNKFAIATNIADVCIVSETE